LKNLNPQCGIWLWMVPLCNRKTQHVPQVRVNYE
jgi:hypothetical protein